MHSRTATKAAHAAAQSLRAIFVGAQPLQPSELAPDMVIAWISVDPIAIGISRIWTPASSVRIMMSKVARRKTAWSIGSL